MWEMYMLSWYLFNKLAVGLNNGLDMASEPGADTPDHIPIHGGDYLSDGGYQAGLDAIGISIGMSLKFALDKITHQLKMCVRFVRFMAIRRVK